MRAALALLLVLALATVSLLAPVARAQGITAILEGPSAIGTGASEKYNLTVAGGPGVSGGTLTVRYWITGSDLGGARPIQSAPGTASATNGTRVVLNVTAPTKDQTITLVAEVNLTKGSESELTQVTKAISVLTPIQLTATFRNTSPVAALNVSVEFSVDGTPAGRTTIRRIDPGATGVATISWLPVGLTPGAHTVSATADLNGNGSIEPELGEAQNSSRFYGTTPEVSWGLIVLIIAAVLLAGLIANSAIKRRRQQPRP